MSGASNYHDALAQLRAEGLLVDSLEIGRLVRCRVDGDRERRGWYSLHEITTAKGELLIVGAFGVWRGATNNALKIELRREHADPMTAEQRAALKARIRRERLAAEAVRKAEAARAAARAQAVWLKCLPAGDAEYLRRKGVRAHGVRFTDSGAIAIPMLDVQGRVHGLQFVLPADHQRRKKTGRDKEFWPAGLVKRGHFFLIGAPPQVGGVILLAEGYATGATLHEATGLPVAIAFDAGNLVPVAEALAGRYRRARIVVCGDDDYLTDGNPGAAAAADAALAVGGTHLVPVFGRDREGRKLTDFNDLQALEGLHVVRIQLEAHLRQQGMPDGERGPRALDDSGGEGGTGDPSDFHFSLDALLERMTLVYGTDTVFDERERMILGLGPLRSAAGKSHVRMWLEHPARKTVLQEAVGFDPTGRNAQVICNLWGGWPTAPAEGKCDALLRILEHLCSREDRPREVYQWVLKWMAYVLQHPGAKMQTALLIHGPEGTGKNTVFGAYRQAFGRYGCTFTQVELESQFNGWSSGKLFGIGNEVVTRAELYHQQGRLRNMITESEWMVNEKNLPTRLEQNHCNFVFFSNRIDIAKLDPDDRRYCVIWTPGPAERELYLEARDELAEGGAEALHWHLLHKVDTEDFDAHTKPPTTRAKRELIGLSMDSTERFWVEWALPDGELHSLFMPARNAQVYEAFRLYCRRIGLAKPPMQDTLTTLLGKKEGMLIARCEVRVGGVKRQQRCCFTPNLHDPPDYVDKSKVEWMTDCCEAFDRELERLQDSGVLPSAERGGRVRAGEPSAEAMAA